MNITQLISELESRDIRLSIRHDTILIDSPKGKLTGTEIELIRQNKLQIIDALKRSGWQPESFCDCGAALTLRRVFNGYIEIKISDDLGISGHGEGLCLACGQVLETPDILSQIEYMFSIPPGTFSNELKFIDGEPEATRESFAWDRYSSLVNHIKKYCPTLTGEHLELVKLEFKESIKKILQKVA